MKEINIKYTNESHRFMINKYKIILSKSFDRVQTLFKEFQKGIEKVSASEFAEIITQNNMMINEVTVDTKRSLVVLIHPWSDLMEATKLTTKSLFYKYIENCLGDIEMNELFQTLTHVYEITSNELIHEATLLNYKDVAMSYKLSPFSVKQMIKLVELEIIKDDYYADIKDLSRKEILNLFLKTIEQTSKYFRDFDYYVLLDCIELNDEVICLLESMPDNVNIIVYPHEIKVELKKENVYLIGKNNVDLFLDEDIYQNVMMNQSNTNNLDEFKEYLDLIFDSEYNNLYANTIIKNI